MSRTGRSLPPGKIRYPLYRRLGGAQGRSGHVQKISTPPGFDPWTIQPVASRYTDYTTWPIHASYSIHVSVHLLVLVWGEEGLHCYKFFNPIHSDMYKKEFRTQCYSFMPNKCSQVNLPLCLKPWVKAYRKHRHRIPGNHDLATSSPGQEPKMDKMYTGPQGCYKQVGKVKKATDNFYICTVHSRYEDFFIKIQLMHSL